MRRRDFFGVLGGAAVAWAVVGWGPPAGGGVVFGGAPFVAFPNGVRLGVKKAGAGEGPKVVIEYRWAAGQYERLPALVADLINRQVVVIAAPADPSALAAKAATATIPIVFFSGSDPVKLGLVAGLNRPGGNATGVSTLS